MDVALGRHLQQADPVEDRQVVADRRLLQPDQRRQLLDAAPLVHQQADDPQPLLVGEGLQEGQGRVEIRRLHRMAP